MPPRMTDEEVKAWEKKCPILRFEKYLGNKGALDEGGIADIRKELEEEVLRGVKSFEKMCVPAPEKLFDYTFETLPPELQEQKEEFLALVGASEQAGTAVTAPPRAQQAALGLRIRRPLVADAPGR